jgi:hypothetical protein
MTSPSTTTPSARASADAANQLEYMADMILELKQMASRGGYNKLTMMLALAEAEARDLTRTARSPEALP